jgi:TolA-binding protein
MNVATARVLSGDRERAAAALESIRSEAANSPIPAGRKALFLLGQLYTEMGEYEKSDAAFKDYLAATEGWSDPETLRMREYASSRL